MLMSGTNVSFFSLSYCKFVVVMHGLFHGHERCSRLLIEFYINCFAIEIILNDLNMYTRKKKKTFIYTIQSKESAFTCCAGPNEQFSFTLSALRT